MLLDEARGCRGGALVVRGQPGVGKSALLADLVDGAGSDVAEGMQVLRTRGIESESPLPFAALQRLLRPVMRHVEHLPARQATALRAAFGETDTAAGDRFLVFLATLSLLAEAAEESPVLCVVDDAHWLDEASTAALLFVARRLGPERVALLFAARDGDVRRFDSDELPELVVGGIDAAAATALLTDRAGVPVADDVRDRLMKQTGGNPLALVELPGSLTPAQLAGAGTLAVGPAADPGGAAGLPGPQPPAIHRRADPAVCRGRRRLDQGERGPAGRGTPRRRPGRVDRGGGIGVADHCRGRDRFSSPAGSFRRLSGRRHAMFGSRRTGRWLRC